MSRIQRHSQSRRLVLNDEWLDSVGWANEASTPTFSLGKFGKWRVVRELGSGGAGKTVLAQRLDSDGPPLAIKLVKVASVSGNSEAESFLHEAKILESLNSNYIVKVRGAGIDGDVPWVAMDFVDGPTLWDEVAKGPLSETHLSTLILNLTQALVDAHEAKISHNDLKPPNIMFDKRLSRYVVIDYGLGKFQRIGGVKHRAFQGTPFYVPQEQHFGQTFITSDVYSAGVCIVQAITGTNPWRDAADPEILATGIGGIISESARTATMVMDLGDVPNEWLSVLHGMLDRDPKARFSAIQARDEWQKVLGATRSLEAVDVSTAQADKPDDAFQSGKIEFDSWLEVERSIAEKIDRVGLENFTLDVNTSRKMVVNFRVRPIDGGFQLYCPTTAKRVMMSRLGWASNPRTEEHTRSVANATPSAVVAKDISSALQIGFEVKLSEVGILI